MKQCSHNVLVIWASQKKLIEGVHFENDVVYRVSLHQAWNLNSRMLSWQQNENFKRTKETRNLRYGFLAIHNIIQLPCAVGWAIGGVVSGGGGVGSNFAFTIRDYNVIMTIKFQLKSEGCNWLMLSWCMWTTKCKIDVHQYSRKGFVWIEDAWSSKLGWS